MAIEFMPDSKTLVTGGYDKSIKLWDLNTLTLLSSINFDSAIFSIAVSPCGNYIAAGDLGGNIHICDGRRFSGTSK